MKKGVWFKVLLIIGVLLVISTIAFLTMPKLNLKGEDVTVLLNENYIEPGYTVKVLWFDISNNVIVNDNIDTSKVGTYQIKYKLDYLFDIIKMRNVYVIETEPPELVLNGEEDTYVCPNTTYVEEGYTSIDNYDGDITDKVTVDIKEDEITYISIDTSNNVSKKVRTLTYEDNKAPELELIGGDYNIRRGNNYNEQGYKATDNCLGDITDKVEVSSNINTNVNGTYTVTYKVSDGVNETIKTRTVYVTSGVATLGTENTPGVIYLTFDDGPSNNTPTILNILKKYNVKATFFVVPNNSNLHYLIKQEYDEGHSIGIHSMSHNYAIVYASDESVYSDINQVNEVIKRLTGNYTYLYRYPGGSSNTVSKKYSIGVISRTAFKIHEMGYHYFDWNISSGDAVSVNLDPNVVANNVINSLSKNRYNVVLMHDSKLHTANAIEKIITYGIDNGYTFAPITMNTREVHHGIAN